MYRPHKFSDTSLARLSTVHPNLQNIMHKAIELSPVDFTVLEGVRSKERQRKLVDTGKSKTMESLHLMQEDGYAHAIDIAPWPIDWQDLDRFHVLAGVVLSIAAMHHTVIRWGGDWNMNGDLTDQTFFDLPHYEFRGVR